MVDFSFKIANLIGRCLINLDQDGEASNCAMCHFSSHCEEREMIGITIVIRSTSSIAECSRLSHVEVACSPCGERKSNFIDNSQIIFIKTQMH